MSAPRKLRDGENPQVGDVFEMFDGAFSTAIVTYVHADGSVNAERPMMKITGVVPNPVISVERISRISSENIRQYTFHTYRDEIDNRWYDCPGEQRRSRRTTDMQTISVSRDFSEFAAGRTRDDGDFSGERFREDFLVPALKVEPKVCVKLDGAMGYGSSFLEEAFGGLVRLHGYTAAQLKQKLEIESWDKSYVTEVWEYVRDARGGSRRRRNGRLRHGSAALGDCNRGNHERD